MSLHFINPALLLGLLGLALPVLIHLLSRRRYDIVQWGAMQFLEIGRAARRRLRLEQLLLMLLRMGLIALIVLAVARPWARGGFLASLVATQSRDVVLIIDGSYSMGWEGDALTPHAAARQWAHRFLEDLRPGDTVTLIDARERPRLPIDPPTRDLSLVRDQLDSLPPPAGSANLAEALIRAVRVLSRTDHPAREVIVLTDGQARGWHAQDENLWLAFDELHKQPSIRPNLWVVNVAGNSTEPRPNFLVERLQLSREMTVPDFPVRITTRVRYTGGQSSETRRVWFEIDGQRLNEKTLQVQLEPGGERTVEFEHRFSSPGSHRVSVVLENDNLPGDNRADAAVVIARAIPVLLVDGGEQPGSARSETFFVQAALSARTNETPWVRGTTITASELAEQPLEEFRAVVLANVATMGEQTSERLRAYVQSGGGLIVAPGDRAEAPESNKLLLTGGLLPASLEAIRQDESTELGGVHIVNGSLELPWLVPFRRENGGDLTQARFAKWWKLTPATQDREAAGGRGAVQALGNNQTPEARAASSDQKPSSAPALRSTDSAQGTPQILARLETGDPFLVSRSFGRGRVLLLAAPLDADWSTLPAQYDYVPLLHELVLHLAAGSSPRNVEAGAPLVLDVPPGTHLSEYAFFGPDKTEFSAEQAGDHLCPVARLDDTLMPGTYVFRSKSDRSSPGEVFVVDFDRSESDLAPLSDAQRGLLKGDGRMAFVASRDELRQKMLTDTSRSELWRVLLLIFVGLLVCETVMTRHLVRGGHADVEEQATEPI